MPTVRIVKNWTWPPLLRQTPGQTGLWEGINFTEDAIDPCDYLIALNKPSANLQVTCPPEHVWAIIQEPPNEISAEMHRGQPGYDRIYTNDPTLVAPRYIHSQPALPWHVNKSYDELMACPAPTKAKNLSWITSNLTVAKGHQLRMSFREKIQGKIDFDLFGRGFQPIEDKWDGLAPYKYALAIENYSNPYYWSEKLADAYLAWCMPVYYGCTKITDYFPAESIIQIDINDPDVIEKIQEATSGQRWEQNLEAIAEARQRILNRFQLFPFFAEKILEHQKASNCASTHQPKVISLLGPQPPRLSWKGHILMRARTILKQMKGIFGAQR